MQQLTPQAADDPEESWREVDIEKNAPDNGEQKSQQENDMEDDGYQQAAGDVVDSEIGKMTNTVPANHCIENEIPNVPVQQQHPAKTRTFYSAFIHLICVIGG